jgi:hypothetical protein
MRVNLLPAKKHDTLLFGLPIDKEDIYWSLALLVACIAVIGAFNLSLNARVDSEQATLDSLNAQTVSMIAQTNDIGQISSDVRRLQQIDRSAIWLKRSGQATALRLAYLGNTIPPDAWVDRLGQDTKGWSIKGAGKSLRSISAVVRGVARVSPRLETLFRAVSSGDSFAYELTIVDPMPSPTPAPPEVKGTP